MSHDSPCLLQVGGRKSAECAVDLCHQPVCDPSGDLCSQHAGQQQLPGMAKSLIYSFKLGAFWHLNEMDKVLNLQHCGIDNPCILYGLYSSLFSFVQIFYNALAI